MIDAAGVKNGAKKIKKILMFLLCAVVLAGPAANAMGEELRYTSADLTREIRLTHGVFYTYARQTENYFEYTPSDIVTPVVVYGSKICNYGNFDTMASLLEKKGYNVLGGINGDYYELANYQPVGLVITDGILRCSDAVFTPLASGKTAPRSSTSLR